MADNITPMPTKPDEFMASVELMRRNLAAFFEHAILVAQLKRAYYDALIKEGFSEQQALELIKVSMTV